MPTALHLPVWSAAVLNVCLGATLMAEDGYGDYAEVDPARINKPSAKVILDADALVVTRLRLVDLFAAPPGQAIGEPLQAIVLPEPTDAQMYAQLVRVVERRAVFVGVYSEAELQVLRATIAYVQKLEQAGEFAERVAVLGRILDGLYRNGCAVDDLTALEQRRGLCDLLHARCGAGDQQPFSDSGKAKQFIRRKIHLQEIQAPKGLVPRPAPVRDPASAF